MGAAVTAELLTEHPYDPTPDHKHGCFPCCRLAWLLRATPDDVEYQFRFRRPHMAARPGFFGGGLTADEFEAYMHVWATAVPRYSHLADPWRAAPEDADVTSIADALRLAMKAGAA